jgi:hypothetical protein
MGTICSKLRHQNVDESNYLSQNLSDWWFELNPQKATFSFGRLNTYSHMSQRQRERSGQTKWTDSFENLMKIWKTGALKLLFKSSLDLSEAQQDLSVKYDCCQAEVFQKACESSNMEDFQILKSLAITKRKLPALDAICGYALQVKKENHGQTKQMFSPCWGQNKKAKKQTFFLFF